MVNGIVVSIKQQILHTKQMRPYIAGLSMYTKYRFEAFPVRVHRRPVTFHQKVVVS